MSPATATAEGLILGAVPYMSPEQARGQSVDKKTDIWAFGCAPYEILSPFTPRESSYAVWTPYGAEVIYRRMREHAVGCIDELPTEADRKRSSWKRFIMVSEAEGSGDVGRRQQVNVILNWSEELKQRVAPAR